MADPTPRERLQPSLLDRLTDDDPGNQRESRERRVMTPSRLRAAVLRDLEWLLNTSGHAVGDDLYDFPELARSVVNFGIPDSSGLTGGALKSAELERAMAEAIRDFEPRILRNSLTVRATVDRQEMSNNMLSFEIEGQLWAEPVPESLYLKTEVDLETGHCQLEGR